MAQQCGSPKTFTATEALEIFRRVKLTSSSGTAVEYADAGDWYMGITQNQPAIGLFADVKDKKDAGTHTCVANAAISAGANIYGADDGKVSTSVTGIIIGIALEAALADGDQIECYLDTSLSEGWS